MEALENFCSHLKELESQKQIDDILALLPEFEKLELRDWSALLDKQNGKQCTTSLYHSEQVKMLLIYWNGKQTSSVHGHPGGGGLIKVLSGSLEEIRFEPDMTEKVIDKSRIEPGLISFIHDLFAWHQVTNPNDAPAVSLHLCSLIRPEEN